MRPFGVEAHGSTLIDMTKQRVAGWALVGSGLFGFLGQLIALLMWQGGAYSLQFNLISDLGMTTCAPVQDGFISRYVCSPGHLWFNLGCLISGALLVLGGVLLRRLPGYLLAVSGIAVAVVGVVPVDRNDLVHDGAALLQAVATWAAMLAVILVARDTHRMLIAVTGVLLLVSIAGFALLVLLPEGAPGLYERISFDLLSVWVIYFGAVLLGTSRKRKPKAKPVDPEQAERDAAVRKAARDLD